MATVRASDPLVARKITRSLEDWIAAAPGRGETYPDGMTFAAGPIRSGRQTFMPDTSYAVGPFPADGMGANDRAPEFAVEVRSKNDYGPAQNREYAAKRVDYFEAGTLVVWDVDPVAKTVKCYRAANPLTPQVFTTGEEADAEPAVPGWRVSVDAVMRT